MFIPQFFKVPSVQVLTKERRGEIQYPQKKESKFSVPQTLLTDLVGWLNNPNPYSLQTHFPFPSSYSDDLLDKGL